MGAAASSAPPAAVGDGGDGAPPTEASAPPAAVGDGGDGAPPTEATAQAATPAAVAVMGAARPGAVRLLACLPAFVGLFVGRRLLSRVEAALEQAGCGSALCCVPQPRASVIAWATRRGFEATATAAFPPDMAATFTVPAVLVVLEKPLGRAAARPAQGSRTAAAAADAAVVDAAPAKRPPPASAPPTPAPASAVLPPALAQQGDVSAVD